MIVSLPMYDWPELRSSHDLFWDLLCENLKTKGIDEPQKLSRAVKEDSYWLSPDLLFGQTCGYPFSTLLKGKARYLATPVYGVAGCARGYYSSAIIAHKDSNIEPGNMSGSRFACNSLMSWSGYRTMIREYGRLEDYFSEIAESGGHRNSARLVADGKADIAALDAVCWHLLQHHEPDTAESLKVVSWSGMHPALPFITSLQTSTEIADNLITGLKEVIASAEYKEVGKVLTLEGCEILDPDSYLGLSRVD